MSPQTPFPGVAFVTGAGGTGMGNAIAKSFVREGCTKIVISDISSTSLESTVSDLKSINPDTTILAKVTDVSDAQSVDALFAEVQQTFGRIDYAVNNAGIMGPFASTSEMTIEEFDKVTNVNYRGVWLCEKRELEMMKSQEVLPGGDGARRSRGSIVNIASQLGVVGRSNAPVYCSSKSAVMALTRCDAIDHSPYQIRVNAVCPGIIGTPMTTRPKDDDPNSDPYPHLRKEIDDTPMKRVGTPQEVADVVLFLSSDKASFVQGASWVVDGGYVIQ